MKLDDGKTRYLMGAANDFFMRLPKPTPADEAKVIRMVGREARDGVELREFLEMLGFMEAA